MSKLKVKKKLSKKRDEEEVDEDISFDDLPIHPVTKLGKFHAAAYYGRAGSGKTTLLSTYPGPILHLDVRDKGTDSVSDVEDMDSICLEDWDTLETIYWALKKGETKYKGGTLGIDTATNLQQLAIEKILKKKKKTTARAGDWGTMTKQDWGDVAALMKEWITNFRDLQKTMNVVFLAQDRVFNVDEDSLEGEGLSPEVGPRMSPSVSSHLNASVSILGHTFIKTKTKIVEVNGKKKEKQKQVYCLRLGANETYITKVRKPKGIELPNFIEDPTYDDIIAIMKGKN